MVPLSSGASIEVGGKRLDILSAWTLHTDLVHQQPSQQLWWLAGDLSRSWRIYPLRAESYRALMVFSGSGTCKVSFDVFLTVRHSIDLSKFQLSAHSLNIQQYKLHYTPQHVSSSTLLITRRTNCITTASGIVTLCKQPYIMRVESCSKHVEECNVTYIVEY